jgi:RNA polymerase sigma factor (sigma-70 family)
VRLTEDGQLFLAEWSAEFGTGIGLFRRSWPKVYKAARESGLADDDIEGECLLASVAALQFWHPDKSAYSTYLSWKLRSYVQKAIYHSNAEFRHGVTVTGNIFLANGEDANIFDIIGDNPLRFHQRNAEERCEFRELAFILREAVTKAIPDRRDREVIARRFGLLGYERQSLIQIAKGMNVSKERIRQIESSSLDRIRAYLKRTKGELLEPMGAGK